MTQNRIGELENEITRLNGVIATIEERYSNFFEKGNDGICYSSFPILTLLDNLLSNAVKFTHLGKVNLEVVARK